MPEAIPPSKDVLAIDGVQWWADARRLREEIETLERAGDRQANVKREKLGRLQRQVLNACLDLLEESARNLDNVHLCRELFEDLLSLYGSFHELSFFPLIEATAVDSQVSPAIFRAAIETLNTQLARLDAEVFACRGKAEEIPLFRSRQQKFEQRLKVFRALRDRCHQLLQKRKQLHPSPQSMMMESVLEHLERQRMHAFRSAQIGQRSFACEQRK